MRMELTMTRTRIALSLLAGLWLACSTERAFTKGEYTDPNEIDLLSDEWAPSDLQLIAKKVVGDLQASPAFALLVAQWWPEAWGRRADRVGRRLMVVALLVLGPVLALLFLTVQTEHARWLADPAPDVADAAADEASSAGT